MIRVYIQYSYGGYKTFFIDCVEDRELVKSEVTDSETYGFPAEVCRYFQYGGAKLLYRYLEDGRLSLVVREIPSVHRDGDGRSIPCAVQFVGDAADRGTLDSIAVDIAAGIESFELFFANLFRIRQGLRIDGAQLRSWIEGHSEAAVCDCDVPQIKNIPRIKGGVILFVPTSGNFGVDKTVTHNVVAELKLPIDQMRNDDCVLPIAVLPRIRGSAKMSVGVSAPKQMDTTALLSGKEEGGDTIRPADEKKANVTTPVPSSSQPVPTMLVAAESLTNKLQQENKELTQKLNLYRKLLYAVCGAASLFLILWIFS